MSTAIRLIGSVLLGAAATILFTSSASAAEVRAAVAANFARPIRTLAAAFEAQTGHTIVVSLGSTGKLYAQIRHGAPFDVLLAADSATPQKLQVEGLAVAGTRFTYAMGRLALWSAQPGYVDAGGEVLRTGTFERLAIADPKLAPYGVAAVEVLAKLGELERLKPRLVTGENIGQAWQFVSTRNAPLGFVALSQILVDGRLGAGSAWFVPAHLYTPIRQDAVLLEPGAGNDGAKALLAFLRSASARRMIRDAGYGDDD